MRKLIKMTAFLTILAFCAVLCAAVLPGSVKALTCGDLAYTVSQEQVTIVDCASTAYGQLQIPSEIDGYPVTAIGNYAFYNCKGLTSVTIPESVVSIGSYAFCYCSNLQSVSIPDSVLTIGNYGFFSCSGLASVALPENLTQIGNYAFAYCARLATIQIPTTVETVGSFAFSFCSVLDGIWVSEDNENYLSDESGVLYNKAMTTLLQAPGSISGDYTVAPTVKTISNMAFNTCRSLTAVSIPASVTSIGQYAFLFCSGLTGIWVDGQNTAYTSDTTGVLYNKAMTTLIQAPGAYAGNYVVGDAVTKLEAYAFASCNGLTGISIGSGVAQIGNYALAECRQLSAITMDPANAAYYSDSAGVLYDKSQTALIQAPGGICGSYIIPETVVSIGNEAFCYCAGLTDITVPAGVTAIGDYAFSYCDSLSAVNYTGSDAQWALIEMGENNDALLDATLCTEYGWAKITLHSADAYLPVGGKALFTVAATGDGLTYRWQYRTSETGNWLNSPAGGNKTATLTVPVTAGRNGYQYRCQISDRFENVIYSNACTLYVVPLQIRSQPETLTLTVGDTAKFTASVEATEPSYRWQYRTGDTDTWKNSPATGNKTATLTVPATNSRNGYQYRCVITDVYGNRIISDVATINVLSLNITTQPGDTHALLGETAQLTVAANSDALTYQWQYRTSATGSWSNSPATGNKTAVLQIPVTKGRNGYQYRCKLTNAYDVTVISDVATLYVLQLSVTSEPVSANMPVGATAKFAVAAKGTGLTYQWQYRVAADAQWKNATASGNKTAELTVPVTAGRNGFDYRCQITDGYDHVIYSDIVSLNVVKLAVTTQPVNKTLATGKTAKFTFVAEGTEPTYQWQYRVSDTAGWSNSPATGNKTATLSVPVTAGRDGYQYRCVITDVYGNVIYTDVVTLLVQ